MTEIFKDIRGYERLYQISNFGRVKSWPKIVKAKGKKWYIIDEKMLNGFKTKKGYVAVALYKDKVKQTFQVHRLVALNFISNPKNKPEINHINGIKSDNKIENLEWCTGSENVRHSFQIGLSKPRIGTLNGASKLNDDKVLAIKNKYKEGKSTYRGIAFEFGVDYAVIQRIMKGTSWVHVK